MIARNQSEVIQLLYVYKFRCGNKFAFYYHLRELRTNDFFGLWKIFSHRVIDMFAISYINASTTLHICHMDRNRIKYDTVVHFFMCPHLMNSDDQLFRLFGYQNDFLNHSKLNFCDLLYFSNFVCSRYYFLFNGILGTHYYYSYNCCEKQIFSK